MGIVVDGFEAVAEAVVDKTAHILSASAVILDERGVVVASDRPQMIGVRFDQLPKSSQGFLRVPLNLDDREAEIIVTQSDTGDFISPRLAQILVDLIVNQTAVVDRLPTNHALKNKFVHDLLLGDMRDEGTILREGEVLGMDLSAPRAVILIDASEFIVGRQHEEGGDDLAQHRAELVIGGIVHFFDLPSDTICGYIGGGEVVVLKASSSKDLEAWTDDAEAMQQWVPSWANLTALKRAAKALLDRLRRDTHTSINIGLGRYHPGIRGLPSSYGDARAALRLGLRFDGPNRVHCLDGLGIASFVGVADERTKVDLAGHLLSPLDHEPELLNTLDGFFKHDCSASLTASKLCIHRNTLAYRLDKITSLTGLDPRRFDDAVQIRVAMTLRSLREAA